MRDLLGEPDARRAAAAAVAALETGAYAGCNLVCLDADTAVVVHGGDWLRVRPLPPGVHLLANGEINDPADRRLRHAADWLAGQALSRSGEALTALAALCASGEPAGTPICFHDERRGTVASSLLALTPRLNAATYLHAQGAPDRVCYHDVSPLLRHLADDRGV